MKTPREPARPARVVDWPKVFFVFGALVLLVFALVGPWFLRQWQRSAAQSEAERIKIVGDMLETPEGRLYIEYLEARGK
jgi:flagellar biogenesis protein FliO